ncbi:hypothetical protein MNAN1_000771 [Malassezia nana]|uniref:Uncharacterized protein n=1 Tax=Malassezia nana TaxID=180528 RepID=A0AAF0EJM6_9BASI|nr:hypothetical protein MNAN1_000771 [Malassezia nana]
MLTDMNGLKVSRPQNLRHKYRRQYQSYDQQMQIQNASVAAKDTSDILNVVNEVIGIPGLIDPNAPSWATQQNGLQVWWDDQDSGDSTQVPWFKDAQGANFSFNPTANVDLDTQTGGWKGLPQELDCSVDGLPWPNGQKLFILNTSLPVTDEKYQGQSVVQPFYVSDPSTYMNDPTRVKRVVLTFPGKPRDSWKYANLFNNALMWIYANPDQYPSVKKGEVVIIAPAVLNMDDQAAGGVEENWVAYRKSNWQMGGTSHYPPLQNGTVTFYSALDKIIEAVMDRSWFPNVNQIVIGGHSMGGQAAMRYALMRKERRYESNVKFWIANPGSWSWLTNSTDVLRPNYAPQNLGGQPSCQGDLDTWPYGLGGNTTKITKYARNRVMENTSETVALYKWRSIHYSLALLDNGSGDTHCEAQYQGYSHLHRGSNFALALAQMDSGWPANHSLTYVAGVSHQDYEMIAHETTMQYVFLKDYDIRFPDLYESHSKSNASDSAYTGDHEWEAPIYRTIAWIVLVVCIIAVVACLGICHYCFKANANDWDRDYWEYDSKRRLL